MWKCAACRRQFSVLTGTVLQGTRVDVAVWLAVFQAVADARGGRGGSSSGEALGTALDARRIAAAHGVTGEAARGVARRIAAALDISRRRPTRSLVPVPSNSRAVPADRSADAAADSHAPATAPGGPVDLSISGEALVRAVLALPSTRAAAIHDQHPSRRRPERQVGPSADYGDPPPR